MIRGARGGNRPRAGIRFHIGDPIEVDVIRVRGRGVSADLTFYNRGITLFQTDSEERRRIHRFCCMLVNTPPSG